MCVTDRHDMTVADKGALNPNTTNQPLLTLYHTIPTFKEKPFENIVGKEESAGNQHFLPFSTMFSTLLRTKIIISAYFYSAYFILSSANAFNLDRSRIFLFGEELTRYGSLMKKQLFPSRLFALLTLPQTTNFRLFQTERVLQTTISNLMYVTGNSSNV